MGVARVGPPVSSMVLASNIFRVTLIEIFTGEVVTAVTGKYPPSDHSSFPESVLASSPTVSTGVTASVCCEPTFDALFGEFEIEVS